MPFAGLELGLAFAKLELLVFARLVLFLLAFVKLEVESEFAKLELGLAFAKLEVESEFAILEFGLTFEVLEVAVQSANTRDQFESFPDASFCDEPKDRNYAHKSYDNPDT